jgi:HD-GYP domain-containing protein (c-di-GMP phosphodiesterase class II)
MDGGAGKGLLAVERGALLSMALDDLAPENLEILMGLGVDPRHVMSALLDIILAREGQDPCSARAGLSDAARLLSEHGIPWSISCGLCQALAKNVFEHLDGGNSELAPTNIGLGVLRAQTLLLGSFMDAEAERGERIARKLREVDRFPDTIAATLDPPTLTRIGLDRLKGLVEMDEATIMYVDSERFLIPLAGDLAAGGERGALKPAPEAEYALFDLKDPYWEEAGEGGTNCPETRDGKGTKSVLMLPMVVRGRTTGVVHLSGGRGGKRLTREEIELAERFVTRFAVALENAHLHAREQQKIKETVALLEITRAINSSLDLREVLDKAARMTVDLCGVVMCVVYLSEEGRQSLLPAAHYGFIEESHWEVERVCGFDAGDLERKHLVALEKGDPVLLRPEEAAAMLSADLMYEHGVDMALLFPLNSREGLTGVFGLFYPCREGDELDREEIEVVGAIAAQAALAIENAVLYEDIEKSYYSTVKALAKAIEVKDPYTHGHSERVTEYALMIADAMRLDERERQKLKYAATLHDIGKIGIAGRVLNKPGDLTDEEYTHVKTHPLLGESIVEPVEFLQGPRPIILHHHERFDGRGYPGGLKGTDIPLCARILSVADAFEAMRSDRPYRRAMPLNNAVEELKRNAGTQFDPRVVEVFLGILERCGGDPIKR